MKHLIFVSAAPADQQASREIGTHFQPSVRDVMLWREEQILPGEQRALTRAQALMNASQMVIVLSPDWLAKEEWIAEALKAHERGVRVVPVHWRACDWQGTPLGRLDLQGLPRDARPLRPMRDRSNVWVEIVQSLRALLSPRHAFDAALHLDRTDQWKNLITGCTAPDHTLFFLWSEERQHIGFFIERVRKHLCDELPPAWRPRYLELPLRMGEMIACTAGEWAMRLSDALRRLPGIAGAASLVRVAEDRPLFIFLGTEPFRANQLDDEVLDGLCAFLRELPKRISEAVPRHPIRVLLSAQYAGQVRASLDRLQQACRQAQPALLYEPLGEPELPTLRDVREFLGQHHPPLKPEICKLVEEAYLEVIASGALDFTTIAARLSTVLG